MAKHKGVYMMNAGEVISADEIKGGMDAHGVTVTKGDVVVCHTGWLSMLDRDAKQFGAGEPGIDAAAAEHVASLEPVAGGMDTWGIEAVPFPNPERIWEGHQILLAKNGVYILEPLDTRALVRDGVTGVLFVLGPERKSGVWGRSG